MKYNFSKLWEEQFWGFYEFKTFYEYASDKELQVAYFKRAGALHVGDDGEMRRIDTPQPLIDASINGFKTALDMIKNQLIVFLFTRYEFIIQDTVKCLICEAPEKSLN